MEKAHDVIPLVCFGCPMVHMCNVHRCMSQQYLWKLISLTLLARRTRQFCNEMGTGSQNENKITDTKCAQTHCNTSHGIICEGATERISTANFEAGIVEDAQLRRKTTQTRSQIGKKICATKHLNYRTVQDSTSHNNSSAIMQILFRLQIRFLYKEFGAKWINFVLN